MTTMTATQCAKNITTFKPTLPHDEHVGGKRPLTEGYAYQGLTLVHFSAQRKHFLLNMLGELRGYSDKNDSG